MGSKLHLSLVNGYAFIDTLSWDAYNEGVHLKEYIENYKTRFGFYPVKGLVDNAYCTRENRKWLKENPVKLSGKPLGWPSAKAVENHISLGERNPIESKFGQAKNGYRLNRVRARLKQSSQTWIASIFLVLNLVKLARQATYCYSFSAYANVLLSEIALKCNQILNKHFVIYKYIPQRTPFIGIVRCVFQKTLINTRIQKRSIALFEY